MVTLRDVASIAGPSAAWPGSAARNQGAAARQPASRHATGPDRGSNHDHSQPGRATASQAWAAYLARQAEADAARQVSSDLGTGEGLHAYLLAQEADAAYDEYADAWYRESHPHAEASDPEPEM